METPMQIEPRSIRRTGIVPPADVLVFRTSVNSPDQVNTLRPLLDLTIAGGGQWNFDLEDCDRILRVESETPVRERIMALLAGFGYACNELE